jgi:hypothetical protein
MKRYGNRNSGISAYEIGDDYIKVKFSDRSETYIYSYREAGKIHVENMKKLAKEGKGLNTYINQHVKDDYDRML